jgi:hypothetical protein
MSVPFETWDAFLDMRRSTFFRGHTSDTVFDRAMNAHLEPSTEAMFTQSNGRVLIGQSANGSFRMIAVPTQVYPAPTGMGEFGLGAGMYHHFDVAMYAGDLTYQLVLEGSDAINLAADDRDNETWYAGDFIPLTRTRAESLEIALVSIAPVVADAHNAPLAPAPLPGPAAAIYCLYLRNTGHEALRGKIVLQASDLFVEHYQDAQPALRDQKRPAVNVHQRTLILTRPFGSVGIHLHQGQWRQTDQTPFEAEVDFELAGGQSQVFETHIAIGASYSDIMPTIFALHLRDALDWANITAAFWRSRLGNLDMGKDEDALFSRDIYVRSLFDNFNCLQIDATGNLLAHWQGAPSHGYGTVWGIDVEPTVVSVAHICPEIAWQGLTFFMTRSRVPRGTQDHSVPILVAPIIIARQWLQITGEVDKFRQNPEVMTALESIMRDLLALESPVDSLFPSIYSSDGVVGRRYDYGTNVKVWYTFDSMAYLLRHLGEPERAQFYHEKAQAIRAAIDKHMTIDGPFGPQVSGGTNLGEDPGDLYLPEDEPYYDGEDTSSMLAPIYGICDFTDQPWMNYHRFARSLWAPGYDPEFDVLLWAPGDPAIFDGTAYFSHLGGCVTREEMREALDTLRQVGVDDVTGSVFWWPHGLEYKRALTRCSQGQGAWAWQYLYQWLGLKIDANANELTVAPRGLLTSFEWTNFRAGEHSFDIRWSEDNTAGIARIRNNNKEPWTIQVGFRESGAGAEGGLVWQTRSLAPGEELKFVQAQTPCRDHLGINRETLVKLEADAFADLAGVGFKRYGPSYLWGHWDANRLWDPQAMPFALRFVILNGTTTDWSDVSVTLTIPDGWTGQGRQPRHWPPPENMTPSCACVELGSLPALRREVAAFWIKQPDKLDLWRRFFWDRDGIPFHKPVHSDRTITLYTNDQEPVPAVTFEAELVAKSADGQEIRRRIEVPVNILNHASRKHQS